MSTASFIRLRQADGSGSFAEFLMHEAALQHELVHHDRFGPHVEIRLDDAWVSLVRHPNPPWLAPLAERAIEAARVNDPAGIEQLADRILRTSTLAEHEAVRVAQFLKAHLDLCEGRYRQAVPLLEAAARVPSDFSPAAHANLGFAWAYLRNPAAALEAWDGALRDDPLFLAPRLSLRNMALVLAEEHAPQLPGHPSWRDIAGREAATLSQVPAAQVRALLDPRRRFPSHALWHVFGRGPYFPGIGSQLARHAHGQRAAARLLQVAQQAICDGDYEQAQLLAGQAADFSPVLKPEADRVAAAAATRLEEDRLVELAERLIGRLRAFLRDLNNLSLEDLDAARESLILLAPHLQEEELQRLYRQRIERVIVAALEQSDQDRRSPLLTIAHQYARSESAGAYQRAADYCLAHQAMRIFWKAVANNDAATAADALQRATNFVEPHDSILHNERAILQRLERNRAVQEATAGAS